MVHRLQAAIALPTIAAAARGCLSCFITRHDYPMNQLFQFSFAGNCPSDHARGNSHWVLCVAVAGIVFACNPASAQSVNSSVQEAPAAGGIIGLGVTSLPKHPGSDQIKAIPVFEYHWANGLFMGGEHDTLVGYQVATRPQLQYGVALGVEAHQRLIRPAVVVYRW